MFSSVDEIHRHVAYNECEDMEAKRSDQCDVERMPQTEQIFVEVFQKLRYENEKKSNL